MSLRNLAAKLLALPITIENSVAIAIGFAGVMLWLTGGLIEIKGADPWNLLLRSFFLLFHRITFIFLGFGGLALLIRWIRSEVLSARLDARDDYHQLRVFVVVFILTGSGALAAMCGQPLVSVVQQSIQLLQSWGIWEGIRRGNEFSFLYLFPVFAILLLPGLALMTAFAFAIGAFSVLGYLFLKLENTPRLLLRSLCLQVAYLLALFSAFAFLAAVTDFVNAAPHLEDYRDQIFSWLTSQSGQYAPLTQRLSWLLPGFFLTVVIILREADQCLATTARATVSEELPVHTSQDVSTDILHEVSAVESSASSYHASVLDTDPRFQDTSYLVKYRFLSNPLYKTFDIYDSENTLIFAARMSSVNPLKRDIMVYGCDHERSAIVSINGTRLVRFPNKFEMRYCPTNETIGTFICCDDAWAILDQQGQHIARMDSKEESFGAAKAEIRMGSLPVCQFNFVNVIRPIIMIDFPDEAKLMFDKRLGIGLALVLGFNSVAFNYLEPQGITT